VEVLSDRIFKGNSRYSFHNVIVVFNEIKLENVTDGISKYVLHLISE
jgi:hypothetical protein